MTKFSQFLAKAAAAAGPKSRLESSSLSKNIEGVDPSVDSKSVVIKHIKEVGNVQQLQFGSGGPSKFIMDHREKLR